MKIKIRKIKSNAKIPTKGSDFSAGFDLYACLSTEVVIQPNQTQKIPTGLAIELPAGYCGLIFARSGLATNSGLAPANKVGVCDSDYRGEYIVALHNHSNKPQTIKPFDRIAQLIIMPVLNSVNFVEVDELNLTNRGNNGFGSTGV